MTNGKSPKSECRIPKEARISNDKNFRATASKSLQVGFWELGFWHSFVIRHLDFGIHLWNSSELDRPAASGMFVGAMPPIFSAAVGEFLDHYQRDVPVRWSPKDLAAQQEFVNGHVIGCGWLDWSTASVALQLVQAGHAQTSLGAPEKHDALVLAGPIVELIEPSTLFRQAVSPLRPRGKLIGLMPCLRDNSPESRIFAERSALTLWPYYTVEELLEMLCETGWEVDSAASGFIGIGQFNAAVLKDQLGFTGFAKIFKQLAAEGYDPMEVGWGELRFIATLNL